MQDRVKAYASDPDVVPGFRELLRRGAAAAGGGLLTQAPANTGAGWNTLATGAWPGTAGSTNNTFHVNGQPFANRTSAFDAGVLQAETLAQAAERAGRRVVQIEWAGGRVGAIDGPTLDFRNFRSGRGVATNYISPTDDAAFTAAFGLQFDHPAGFAGQAPFPGAAPAPATGWTGRTRFVQPGAGDAAAGPRRRHGQVRPQRLPLRQHRRRCDELRPRAALPRQERRRRGAGRGPRGRRVGRRQGDASRAPTPSTARPAAFLAKVERLAPDLSEVRLFHTSVTRAIATWPSWPGVPGFTGDFEDYVAATFPSSQAGDFAILEAGIVSEETYAEQGALLGDQPTTR